MESKIDGRTAEEELAHRRNFIKKASKMAMTVPAVALLLSMESKRAQADAAPPISGGLRNPI